MKVTQEFLDKLEGAKITDHNPIDPKFHSEHPTNSVQKRWVFDVQWSDCPKFVEDEVRQIWRNEGLANDTSIFKFCMEEEWYADHPNIAQWLSHKGVQDGEVVFIHWWW